MLRFDRFPFTNVHPSWHEHVNLGDVVSKTNFEMFPLRGRSLKNSKTGRFLVPPL